MPSGPQPPPRIPRCPASRRPRCCKRTVAPGPSPLALSYLPSSCPPLPHEFRDVALGRIVVAKAQLCRPPRATAAQRGPLWLRRPRLLEKFILISLKYFTENASVVALPGACPTAMLAKLWRDDGVVREEEKKRKCKGRSSMLSNIPTKRTTEHHYNR